MISVLLVAADVIVTSYQILWMHDRSLNNILISSWMSHCCLPESQVSGYVWQFDEKSCHCLRLVDSIYVERGAARFNGMGERSWFFATKKHGTWELVFKLVRPWSRPSPEFGVHIEVK